MTPAVFTRMGATITFTANVAAPSGVQAAAADAKAQATIYELVNSGTALAFFASGTSAAAAAANAVIPTGTATNVWCVLPGAARFVTDIPNAFWSGISTASEVCYVTPVM